MTCVVCMTIAGTRVPLARLLGNTLYWNDMGLLTRGFEHKKETGGLDSGLRRNDTVIGSSLARSVPDYLVAPTSVGRPLHKILTGSASWKLTKTCR